MLSFIETLSFYATITTMKKILFILTVLLCATSSSLSYASDEGRELAKEKAQKAIDACWAISQEDRDSGVTGRMRSGALDSALCMEEHTLMLSETVLFKNNKQAQAEVKESLEKITDGTGRLYWLLHNSHDGCGGACGSMYQILHNSQVAKEMEEVVRDFYIKIEDYKDEL